MKADTGFGERITEITEITEPEAEVVDSESISSGNVLVQLIYPGPLLLCICTGSPPCYRQCNQL